MSAHPIDLHGLSAAGRDPAAALEELAASFALRDQAEAEELIESFCGDAIRNWQLQDATFWQRVKFRARLLRARRPAACTECIFPDPKS